MTILWFVGEPGVGKTTVVRRMLELNGPYEVLQEPKQKWTIAADGAFVAAGNYTGATFDGADTIGYAGVQTHLAYWLEHLSKAELTLLDGDRFSYGAIPEWFKSFTPDQKLLCCHFTGPALERRLLRGSNQNESWIKGRITKARKFADIFPGRVFEIDTSTQTPDELAKAILEIE